MITKLQARHVRDIAKAQVYAWRIAFKGILSEALLSGLSIDAFEKKWRNRLTDTNTQYFIWLNESKEGVGFISFGAPKDEEETADFEIYGIYVHPGYWGKSIGHRLMAFGCSKMKESKPTAKIILWTMKDNTLSQRFYLRSGFAESGKKRISERYGETFEEVQFERQ